MSLQTWADKRFAKGIAKAMKRTYFVCKESMPNASEEEILRKVVSLRPSQKAKKLLEDKDFWNEKENLNLWDVTLAIIIKEYRKGHLEKRLLLIPRDSNYNLMSGLNEVLGDFKK